MPGQILNLMGEPSMSQFADSITGKALTLLEFQKQLTKYGISNAVFYEYLYSEDAADRNNILADAHVIHIMY